MRVVLLYWKNRPDNPFEIFSNLRLLSNRYPGFNYNTLNNYLSKNKLPFENQDVRIERVEVNRHAAAAIPGRKMVLQGRKVRMKGNDEELQDKQFWLSRTPAERLQAATELSLQLLGKEQKMDRTKVVKRKMGK
jgi:hypothetical protein